MSFSVFVFNINFNFLFESVALNFLAKLFFLRSCKFSFSLAEMNKRMDASQDCSKKLWDKTVFFFWVRSKLLNKFFFHLSFFILLFSLDVFPDSTVFFGFYTKHTIHTTYTHTPSKCASDEGTVWHRNGNSNLLSIKISLILCSRIEKKTHSLQVIELSSAVLLRK